MGIPTGPHALNLRVRGLFAGLLSAYGPQGWWPLSGRAGKRGCDMRGYHPRDYAQPRTFEGRFEIIMGTILTQNAGWTNAEKALSRLRKEDIRLPAQILSRSPERLAALIRPSRYYNQKARKLRGIASLFPARDSLARRFKPSREMLLSQWGIGPETADSILLYAYHEPEFVIDAYTRRLLSRIGITTGGEGYDELQHLFHAALPRSHESFNEYHALIVEHAKRHCRAQPLCEDCPVRACRYRDSRRA